MWREAVQQQSGQVWCAPNQPSISTCLQASWPGSDSQRDRPWGNPAFYRTLSDPHHHSWSTRLHAPWSLLVLSFSSWRPSSFLPSILVSQLTVGSNEFKNKKVRKQLSQAVYLITNGLRVNLHLRLLDCRFLPLAWPPENRCSWALHIYTQFSRCRDIPGCNWNSALYLQIHVTFKSGIRLHP